MAPDPAGRPPVLDGMPDDGPGDGCEESPAETIASERKRRLRVVAVAAILLLGVIAIIFTPLFMRL